jgi:hypothetical protein
MSALVQLRERANKEGGKFEKKKKEKRGKRKRTTES